MLKNPVTYAYESNTIDITPAFEFRRNYEEQRGVRLTTSQFHCVWSPEANKYQCFAVFN